jgi:hypothetical protein
MDGVEVAKMGFLPDLDTDLTSLSKEELEAFRRLLEQELAMSKARQKHIEALLARVSARIATLP